MLGIIYMGAGNRTHVLMLTRQVFCWLSYLPNPTLFKSILTTCNYSFHLFNLLQNLNLKEEMLLDIQRISEASVHKVLFTKQWINKQLPFFISGWVDYLFKYWQVWSGQLFSLIRNKDPIKTCLRRFKNTPHVPFSFLLYTTLRQFYPSPKLQLLSLLWVFQPGPFSWASSKYPAAFWTLLLGYLQAPPTQNVQNLPQVMIIENSKLILGLDDTWEYTQASQCSVSLLTDEGAWGI